MFLLLGNGIVQANAYSYLCHYFLNFNSYVLADPL